MAATLSSVYGIYSGYELCENTPVPGREEYLNSEKYDHKVWDWDREGNIREFISRVNRIRETHPALQEYDNLEFYQANDDNVLAYGKRTADNGDIVVGSGQYGSVQCSRCALRITDRQVWFAGGYSVSGR